MRQLRQEQQQLASATNSNRNLVLGHANRATHRIPLMPSIARAVRSQKMTPSRRKDRPSRINSHSEMVSSTFLPNFHDLIKKNEISLKCAQCSFSCVLVSPFPLANAPKFNFGTLTAPVAQAKEQEVKTEHEKENCPGCRGCTDDFVFPEVKDTNFSQFDDNPLPLVPPPKVDMTQHNDLSKDTKKPTQSIPFSLNSSAGGNGFSFGTAIAAATAATNTTTNSTQPSGMFFGNSSFSFNAAGAQDGSANGDSKNSSLFGGSANKPTVTTTSTAAASAETIKPAFSFGSSSAFGASKGMCCLRLNNFFEPFR